VEREITNQDETADRSLFSFDSGGSWGVVVEHCLRSKSSVFSLLERNLIY